MVNCAAGHGQQRRQAVARRDSMAASQRIPMKTSKKSPKRKKSPEKIGACGGPWDPIAPPHEVTSQQSGLPLERNRGLSHTARRRLEPQAMAPSSKPQTVRQTVLIMEASRLHAPVKSEPVCGDHSPRRRYIRAVQSQAIARNPTLVDFAALWAPYNHTNRSRHI